MEWNPSHTLPAEFFDVAQRVYLADDNWIPEQPKEAQALFGSQHSFFEQGSAWVDVIPGKARLAGFIHPDAKLGDEPAAYFGYWEGVDDLGAHKTLFDRFEAWARFRGIKKTVGPINFRTHYNYRLRMNRFDVTPFYPGEPYNPQYYVRLARELGYEPVMNYHSWFADGHATLAIAAEPVARARARAESRGLRFVPLTPQYWTDNIETLHEDTRAIFGDNPGFSQISLQEFKQLLGPDKIAAMDPRCSTLTLDPEGRMVAFMLCFPDYGPLLRQGASPRFEPRQMRFEDHFELLSNPTILGKTVGVMPKYRRLGLFEIMCCITTEASLPYYDRIATVLLRADNVSARWAPTLFADPGCFTHDYALFARSLG